MVPVRCRHVVLESWGMSGPTSQVRKRRFQQIQPIEIHSVLQPDVVDSHAGAQKAGGLLPAFSTALSYLGGTIPLSLTGTSTPMKIYTRTGDEGTTGLIGGTRVSKSDLRLNAYGTIDELNAVLGTARGLDLPPRCDEILQKLQNQMFNLGAELATPTVNQQSTALLDDSVINALESWIDELQEQLPPLTAFILPAGTPGAATLHLARCVCRRAEREIVALAQVSTVRGLVLKYINRVSDLLFVLARTANAAAGVADVEWEKSP